MPGIFQDDMAAIRNLLSMATEIHVLADSLHCQLSEVLTEHALEELQAMENEESLKAGKELIEGIQEAARQARERDQS